MADRDASGRLLPGHSGGGARAGAGRPRKARKELVGKSISDEGWSHIYKAMYDAAVGGDVRAAIFLDERFFGKVVLSEEEAAPEVRPVSIEYRLSSPHEPDQAPE